MSDTDAATENADTMKKPAKAKKKRKPFMHVLGFGGFDEPTHGGLTFFLCLVLGIPSVILFSGLIDELFIGIPVIQDTLAGVGPVMLILVGTLVLAFLAVFWRHWPLIILFILTSAAGIFCIVHMTAIEKDKFFPAVVREKFIPSEERLSEINALRVVRLGRAKDGFQSIPAGSLVTVERIQEDNRVYFSIKHHDTEQTRRGTGDVQLIRTERDVAAIAKANLLASPLENAEVIGEIAKGQRVTLTGGLSADDSLVEVLHEDSTVWLAFDSLFRPAMKPRFFPYSTLSLIIIGGAFVLIYLIFFITALPVNIRYNNKRKAYYEKKRRQFPWLDNHLKETKGPHLSSPVSLSFSDVNEQLLLALFLYSLISVGLGFLIHIFLREFGFMGSIEEKLFSGLTLTTWIIGLVIVIYIFSNNTPTGKYSNSEECPKCRCPDSTLMVSFQKIVDKQMVETKTVKTSSRSSAGAFGGGAIGEGFAAATGSSSSYTISRIYWAGREITTYGCHSCLNTRSETENKEWKALNNIIGMWQDLERPDDEFKESYRLVDGEWKKA